MATYKYTQAYDGSTSDGYAKFNISPDLGSCVAIGETFTITGQVYCSLFPIKRISCTLWTSGGSGTRCSDVLDVNISRGKTGTFSLTTTIPNVSYHIGTNPYVDMFVTIGIANPNNNEGGSTDYKAAHYYRIVKERDAPTVSDVRFTDATGANSHFGSYIQNKSNVTLSFSEATDAVDSSVYIVSRSLTLGGTSYAMSATRLSLGTLNLTGIVDYSITVTDSKGLSGTTTGKLLFAPYQLPSLTAFAVQRYKAVTADDGSISYVAADDGENVWVDLAGSVQAIDGLNAWTLDISYNMGDGDVSRTIISGVDGLAFTKQRDRMLITETIPATVDCTCVLTLTDWFNEPVSLTSSVYKAGGYANLEKFGFAVGMRSTGTADEKKFEVAPDYESHFYGGIFPEGAEEMTLELSSKFKEREDHPLIPTLRRFGPVVELHGEIQPTASISSGTDYHLICTIPEEYAPRNDVITVQQGSTQCIWILRVFARDAETNACKAMFARYRNGSSYTSAGANAWLPFHVVWII